MLLQSDRGRSSHIKNDKLQQEICTSNAVQCWVLECEMVRTQNTGRPQRRGGRDWSFGRSRSRSKKGERRSDVPKKNTALAEHVHHVGLAKMQVIMSQSPISSSTTSKENVSMLVTLEKPFKEAWNPIGKHWDHHWKSVKQIQLPATQMQRKPNFTKS